MPIVVVQPRSPSVARLSPAIARTYWSNPRGFVFAAAGVSIGLGNVWRFPYLVDRHGGAAFVLVYLLCLLVLGLPILMAEVMVGRRGRSNPAACLGTIARAEGRNCRWRVVGWLGAFAGVLILSGYSLIAGWSVVALGQSAAGALAQSRDPAATRLFTLFLGDPWMMVSCQTLFLACAALITGRGIRDGIERAQAWLLPALLLVLLGLVVYAGLATGRLGDGLTRLLRPDFARLGWRGTLEAIRHAVLTLGLGLGAMMSFGAALPERVSITRASLLVVLLDTGVALLATLVVSTILLAGGASMTEGPMLAFMTIPAVANTLPGGACATVAFYGLLVFTSFSCALGILHPIVEHLVGWYRIGRREAALLAGGLAWILGGIAALAATSPRPFGAGRWAIFDWMGYAGSNLLVPVSAIGVVLFSGWAMSRRASRSELDAQTGIFVAWRWLIRYVAPVGLAAVLALGALERFWR